MTLPLSLHAETLDGDSIASGRHRLAEAAPAARPLFASIFFVFFGESLRGQGRGWPNSDRQTDGVAFRRFGSCFKTTPPRLAHGKALVVIKIANCGSSTIFI